VWRRRPWTRVPLREVKRHGGCRCAAVASALAG
jgi:hypothetical protein